MKVECINDKNWMYGTTTLGDSIHYGDIYTVTGTYISERGSDMFLLDSLKRNDPDMGDGWAARRFKPLNRPNQKTVSRSKEVENV